MAGKENSAMTILMDFAKPCKGKLIGSVVLAVLGALCGMIPYIAVSRGIIMICHEDYAFSKLAFLALIALAGYLGQVWFGTFSTMKSHESAFIILRNLRMAITETISRVPTVKIPDTQYGKFKTIIVDTVEKLELPLAHMVPELTANILIPVLILVYLFSLDWRLALISLVTIPVGAFCYMGMMKDYEKRYARVLAAGKNMDAATVEYIGGIEVVKTFNQGERSYKKYADAVAENETSKATADQRLLCDGAFHPDGNACGRAALGELALYKWKGRSGYADYLHHSRPWTRKATDSGIAVHRQPGHGGFHRKRGRESSG